MAQVLFGQRVCDTSFGKYRDGSTAIKLYDNKGAVATATVALDVLPPFGCVWVKDYSENEGMTAALVAAGIIYSEPVARRRSGWVTVYAYKLIGRDS